MTMDEVPNYVFTIAGTKKRLIDCTTDDMMTPDGQEQLAALIAEMH